MDKIGHLHAFLLRWDLGRRLDANIGIPFARWKDSDGVEELINAIEEIVTISRFISDVMEDLRRILE